MCLFYVLVSEGEVLGIEVRFLGGGAFLVLLFPFGYIGHWVILIFIRLGPVLLNECARFTFWFNGNLDERKAEALLVLIGNCFGEYLPGLDLRQYQLLGCGISELATHSLVTFKFLQLTLSRYHPLFSYDDECLRWAK